MDSCSFACAYMAYRVKTDLKEKRDAVVERARRVRASARDLANRVKTEMEHALSEEAEICKSFCLYTSAYY